MATQGLIAIRICQPCVPYLHIYSKLAYLSNPDFCCCCGCGGCSCLCAMPIKLFILPVFPFMPPVMLFMLLPAFIPPIGAPAFAAVGIIGCCEKADTPLLPPGAGFKVKPEEPAPALGLDVAGGGGSEKEDEVRFWAMPGRWLAERAMDDIGVLRPVLTAFVAGGDAQGLGEAAAPQFRAGPVEEVWLSDGVVVVW